jgi:hypothetical protein
VRTRNYSRKVMTNANHANVAHRYFDNHAGVVAEATGC